MLPSLRTNHADRFPRKHAACHLCRHADRQTVIEAGRQTATIAGRPKERSDAARRVLDAIRAARRAGMSWSAIGLFVGTSGEAVRQRYRNEVA